MSGSSRRSAPTSRAGLVVPHFNDDEVAALLDRDELVTALERAFVDLARGRAATTVRVRAGTDGGMASAMAAAAPSFGVTGGKIYATVQGRFTFHVVLFDLEGRVLCTMDGGSLTEARTPALSAVAIRRFAPPAARTAAVLGTGREAWPHIEMLSSVMDLEVVRIWGRRPAAARELAARSQSAGIAAIAATTAEEAVENADVVITVTSANEPVVAADAIGDRALVCAVGATKPERCELDPLLFGRAAAVVTDSPDGAPSECGDLIRATELGLFAWKDVVDLGEALAGQVEVQRAGSGEGPVIFETQGVALQDIVAASLVWGAAEVLRT